ncbi:MAG: carboxypeptidase-like regulatory domain-containing protein [Thermoanaerobaculia bacterium]
MLAQSKELPAPGRSGDLLVFNGVPRIGKLVLKPPAGTCLRQNVLPGPGPTGWSLNRVDVSLCSELSVSLTGLDEGRYPVDLRLTDSEPGTAAIAPVRLKGDGPALFRNLAPRQYDLRVDVARSKLTLSRLVSIPLEDRLEHVVEVSSVHVNGKVTWGGEVATGEIVFEKTDGKKSSLSMRSALDDGGRYEAFLPEAGGYFIELRQEGSEELAPLEFALVEEGKDQVLNLAFAKTRVRGSVLDSKGLPLEGVAADAVARAKDSESNLTAMTDRDGHFTLSTLRPGTVTLSARKRGYREANPTSPFILKSGDDVEMTIVMRERRTAFVTILSASGEPVPKVPVECRSARAPEPCWLADWTDERGVAGIDVERGLPLLCSFPSRDGVLGVFALESDKPVVWQTPPASADLTVVFMDEEGKAVPHRELLVRSNGRCVCSDILMMHTYDHGGWDRSRADGQVRLTALPPGLVEVYLVRSGATLASAVAGSDVDRVLELALQPGEERTVVVTLRRRAEGRKAE